MWMGVGVRVAPGRRGWDRVTAAQRRLLEPALVRHDRTPVAGHLGVPLLEGLPPLGRAAQGGDVVAVPVVRALPRLGHLLGRGRHPGPPADPEGGRDLSHRGAA
jgi:hypothetical protein